MEETISSLKSALGTLKTKSQSFKQPEGNAEDCIKGMEMRAPYKTSEETDLMNLLRSPFVKALISVHDTVRSRMYDTPLPAYDPSFHPKTNVQGRRHGQGAAEPRTVGLHKSPNEPLGITFKMIDNRLVVARILCGGLIHRQGFIQVGDRILEVNGESTSSMNASDLQATLKTCSGSLVMKIEPTSRDPLVPAELFYRAQFDFNPQQDRLIPAKEAGLPFQKGDILKVLNQEDSFWWQAVLVDNREAAKLIPSQMLEERRRAYGNADQNGVVGCMGRKKQKRKVMYSSHHTGEFEAYDMVLYEPVMEVENFQFYTLVLIGAPNIGRRSLKTRLLAEYGTRFAEVKAHTTKYFSAPEDSETYHYVTEEQMRLDIMQHKFLEFGKHQHFLYGIMSDSVMEVIQSKKMPILDVHPQALKKLRTPQFRPFVVFVKASSPEGVRRLHKTAKVDNPYEHTELKEKDFEDCHTESQRIEAIFGHYFDATIVNENIDVAYEELLTVIRVFSSRKQWVPTNWVI
ncbi:hypothetical protein EMCRGX_G018734 [Ephydatia muelleri]